MEFRYEALDKRHSYIEGKIDAVDEMTALKRLAKSGLSVTEIQEVSVFTRFFSDVFGEASKLDEKEVRDLFIEIKSVLASGFSPLEAIDYVAKNSDDHPKFKRIGIVAYQAMVEGETMADGLRTAGISPKYCDVISVGEKSGAIITALDSEIEQIDLSLKTKKGFNTIYIAPAVSGAFMLMATIAAIVWLVPLQEKIIYSLVESKEDVPPISYAAFWIGDYGIQIIVGFVLALIVFLIAKSVLSRLYESVDLFFDSVAIKMPVFGLFYKNSEYSRICSMLRLSMSSGSKQEEVLAIIKDQTKSANMRIKMNQAYNLVKNEGYLMSQAFEELRLNGLIASTLKRGERNDAMDASELMANLSKEFSQKSLYNMEVLKGASEMINMIMLSVLSVPILMISVAPSIDQVTLMMNKF